jgi:hypothetical protein
MDYYESTRPEVDDSALSGGVTFKLGGQIASVSIPKSYVGANYQRDLDGSNVIGTTLPYESHTGDGEAGYDVIFDPVNSLVLTKGSTTVTIDIAGLTANATWQEIDICVDGTPKKMKVLGTAPY